MDDRRRLTAAVEQEIQSKWVSVMASSTRELPEASEQVLAYLRSRESQHTSDYIIRRHIQNCYPQLLEAVEKQSGEKYVDLNKNKNVAWEPGFNQALSECLYKKFSDVAVRRSESIEPTDWLLLAHSYFNYSYFLNRIGAYPLASEYGERALRIRRRFFSEYHPILKSSYYNLKCLCIRMGEEQKASYYAEHESIITQTGI